jgi:predicted amidohydrolase
MSNSTKLSRRNVLAASAGIMGLSPLLPTVSQSAAKTSNAVSVPVNGRNYERVELRKPTTTVSAIQSRVRAVDGNNPAKGIRANLDHMLELIDKAQFFGAPKDLLCFHEFPIQGWNPWDRKQLQRLAIESPGPETEELAAKARQYNCYIKFGAYAVDADWPGHILSITSIIGPDGKLVARDWKARNIKGAFGNFELVTTTVYNVLDRFVEMYGLDAAIPVHRTPIGNLATSSVQLEPELFRAMAMKGAELILRTASGGFTEMDMQMTSAYNKLYTVIVNNAVSPDNPGFMPDAFGGAGGTAIYGPDGDAVAQVDSKFEQQAIASIPLASFRTRHKIPDVHMALYEPIFSSYRPRFDPGLFTEQQPASLKEAKSFLESKDRWR